MRTLSVLLLATIVTVASAADDAVSLRWVPKEGDTLKYQTTGEFDVSGIHATLTSTNVYKVLKVEADGSYLLQISPVDGKAVYAGTEIAVKGMTTLTSYGPTGEVKEIRGDRPDATGYRMANLTTFHSPTKPVKVGDAWSAEGKADATTGAVGWKADYKVEGEDTVGPFKAMRVSVAARETEGTSPGKASGTIWVGKDGVLVRTELDWANLSVPGAPANVSGKFVLNRTQ